MESSSYPPSAAVMNMMTIDSALNELDMLSAVTESRRQFLQERIRSKSEGSVHPSRSASSLETNGFHILQIDTNYVTGFSSCVSDSTVLSQASSAETRDQRLTSAYRDVEDRLEAEARNNRLARIKLARARRFRKPYNIPGRLYHSMQESDFTVDEVGETQQSKSNTASPSKPNVGMLTRSRSLDNLESARLKLTDLFDCVTKEDPQELEQVSRDMENLQVNE